MTDVELLDGLRDELARVGRDLERHRDRRGRAIDEAQWCRHQARLLVSKADLLERIREAA